MNVSGAPAQILVIDDNHDDRARVVSDLSRAFPNLQPVEIASQTQFERALDDNGTNVVITDYQLQWSNGLKILDSVKARYPDWPVIMFTATGTQEIAVEAMKNGLDDYLIKSTAHYVRLSAAVNSALKRREDRLAKRRAEEDLRRALAEKDILVKELQHRVKNIMQIISSMLDLQAQSIHDPAMLEMFRICHGRVRAMAMVHEKLYESKNLASISFSDYAQDLAVDLFSSYGVDQSQIQLKLDVNINGDTIPADTAAPCGLILNELLSNALKHAFPGGMHGEIRVEMRRAGNELYTLVVADNGTGLPRDFDLAKVNSLGLKLVQSLCHEQLRGHLEMLRNGGTEFRITFPSRSRTRSNA